MDHRDGLDVSEKTKSPPAGNQTTIPRSSKPQHTHRTELSRLPVLQGCTNPGLQVAQVTFCTVGPYICGASVWNLFHVTLVAPRILRWLLFGVVWGICAPLCGLSESQSRSE